jgi:Mn2+/Fe2+ NRAMP family transporter
MRGAGLRTERERKGVTRSEMRAARIDVFVGMAFSQVVMYAILMVSAATFNAHGITGIATADQTAKALEPLAGSFAFVLFAAGFIGTGLLAIPVLSAPQLMRWPNSSASKHARRETQVLPHLLRGDRCTDR